MSATTSAAYEPKGWSHEDQERSNDVTAGTEPFHQQQWNGQMFGQMAGTTFYPALLYTQTTDQNIGQASGTLGTSGLHPTTSLSPSTARDPFSPSEYASDIAAYGDGASDYNTPGFNHTFLDYDGSQIMATVTPSSLLSSPEFTQAQTISNTNGFSAPNGSMATFNGPVQPLQQPQVARSMSQPTETSKRAKPSQPQLVVTFDEYEDGNAGSEEIHQQIHRRNSSKAHLSPYIDEDSTDDDESGDNTNLNRTEAGPSQRASFLPPVSNNIRVGVDPETRAALNSEELPSLDEMEEQQRLDEKNAEIAGWLSKSDVASNGGDNAQSYLRRSKARSRPRAKSTNDSPYNNFNTQSSVTGHLTAIPGPGLTLNVPSEMDEEEDDDESCEPGSPPASITPLEDSQGYFSLQRSAGTVEEVPVGTNDKIKSASGMEKAVAGITANMAIMRFRQRAKDTDNASVTATLGSRRLSESDIGSVFGAAGISKLLLSPPQQTERTPVRRKNSFLNNILPNRNNSNKLKRKNSQPVEQGEHAGTGATTSPKDAQGGFAAPKRVSSFGRPKSPRIDTSIPSAANDARSPKAVASAASGAFKQIWRTRSRSDLGKSPKLGLAELMTQHGGPPMPTLASPSQGRVDPAPRTNQPAEDDSGDEDGGPTGDGLTMDLSVRTDMHIIPTYDGFKYQARQLNPRLADFLLERVTQEQVKRYKRLVDSKTRHSQAIGTGPCSAKAFCLLSGGQSQELPPRAANKDPDNVLAVFQIMRQGMTEDDLDVGSNGQQLVPAQFPTGVPPPPVHRLPAEFECPLCFKVKKFYKPSDWTKHVHEDVQPFTCTFLNCNEPKSFKRKADWVRHENERHRQLEYWVCSVQECNHTCYRKDNFVQHLVREHKVPEPKVRTGRATGVKSSPDGTQSWQSRAALTNECLEDVWVLVDKCHKDSPKQPKDEACKFCGNVCTSWKKLTVHLAKHMEQISMPVLSLVEQRKMAVAYANQQTQNMPQSMPTSTKPINELPTFLCDEPMSFEAEPQSMLGVGQAFVPGVMHSYPPMDMALQAQMAATQGNLTPSALSITESSYPPPSIQSRSRGSSFNEQDFSGQGATYPPIGMHSRSMSSSSPPQFDHSGNQRIFYQQPTGMFMQEVMPGNNVYLTPSSNTPASMGYSPHGSTHSLHDAYGFQG